MTEYHTACLDCDQFLFYSYEKFPILTSPPPRRPPSPKKKSVSTLHEKFLKNFHLITISDLTEIWVSSVKLDKTMKLI